MKDPLGRILIVAFFIGSLIYTDKAAAQGVESLMTIIEDLRTEKLTGFNPEYRISEEDSARIVRYLAQTSNFSEAGPDTSIVYFRKAVELSLNTKSLKFLSISIQDMGIYFLRNGMLKEAMACYLKSLEIEQIRNDENRIADLNVSLGYVYRGMNVFIKALEYYHKGLDIYKSVDDTLGLANAYYNIGGLYSVRFYCETRNEQEIHGDCDTALIYNRKAFELYSILHDTMRLADINHSNAFIYNKMGRYKEALAPIQESLQCYKRLNDPDRYANALFFLGTLYRSLKEYDKSIQTIKEAEEIMVANGMKGVQYLYEEMADTYNKAGKYKQAYESYVRYMTLDAEAINKEKSEEIFELETRYQTKVKENEILRLTVDKRRRDNLVMALTGVLFLLAMAVYYYVWLTRKNKVIADQKAQISEAKILELEKEKSYLAARSVMEGEEAERSRLASDLHNGLGGLLSGIKINLSSMKEDSVISKENLGAFNHAISLLDTSISELRRIAHNLMPETLNHYGLRTALEDFCTQVAPRDGKPKIDIKFFGDEIRYTKDIELTMYRIVQELVNNALKHSEASLISIQLFSEPKRLFAQVIDNGKGFDYKGDTKAYHGKGLENIMNRVTAIDGRVEIWSQPGQGTEISVEFEIPMA